MRNHGEAEKSRNGMGDHVLEDGHELTLGLGKASILADDAARTDTYERIEKLVRLIGLRLR